MAGTEASESESNTHLIAELEELTQSLYQTHISSSTTSRRTASLSLPRTTAPAIPVPNETEKTSSRSRSRRLSFSPWKFRQNLDNHDKTEPERDVTASGSTEKKGLWNWRPIRALSHIGMQKISCLFSVEVIAAQGLPPSTNGLRLSVCVRKKESKNGAVQTMPSRVSQGSADFEETLFLNCHVYCSKSQETTKFEPRPFLIYLFAVDAEELSFGTSSVDLSRLIQESVEKLSYEGKRVRQWDRSFGLSGKAKGGELVVKLGFQIMEKDGGIGIYGGSAEGAKIDRSNKFSYSFRRNQSKKSFSVPTPRVRSQSPLMADIQGMDGKTLVEKLEGRNEEDGNVLEIEVVDKGVEAADSENSSTQITRLTELDSIAEQIKALESKIEKDKLTKSETECQKLDSDEETVTIEFLHLLEEEEQQQQEARSNKLKHPDIPPLHLDGEDTNDHRAHVPDLGKGLGCVVQTRNGGYLAATNPLDTAVSRKESPKLAMQISNPLVLPLTSSVTGFELLRRMTALGIDELGSQLLALMPIDELVGKTAEQIAFEGIASAIIEGRSTEGATSSAARIVAAVKTMAAALTAGREERIATGVWNISGETEGLVTVEEAVAFSLQRIEAMAVEALKIQADVAEEDAPFEVSPSNDSVISLEDWVKSDNEASTIAVSVVVQLRDPLRRFEAVGGPILALIQATREENRAVEDDEEERRYKVISVDVAGLRARTEGRKLNAWDGEKQRLTARQWLVAYNAKHRKRSNKQVNDGDNNVRNGGDLLWSVSSRVVADMWLKSMRHPDIKFAA